MYERRTVDDPDVEEEVSNNIREAIERYEPRALVQNIIVDAQPQRNEIRVTIEFQIVNSDEIITFSTSLSRLR